MSIVTSMEREFYEDEDNIRAEAAMTALSHIKNDPRDTFIKYRLAQDKLEALTADAASPAPVRLDAVRVQSSNQHDLTDAYLKIEAARAARDKAQAAFMEAETRLSSVLHEADISDTDRDTWWLKYGTHDPYYSNNAQIAQKLNLSTRQAAYSLSNRRVIVKILLAIEKLGYWRDYVVS